MQMTKRRLVARNHSLGTIGLVVCVVATSPQGAMASAGAANGQPNIIFILTDDMRADAMGCAGNRMIQTPNLDRLAGGGFRFRNAFCTTSICATSRASLLTGQYARRHKIEDFASPLENQAFAQTFPAILRRNGYRTGFVGKWGLGGEMPTEALDFWAGFSGQGQYFDEPGGEHLTGRLGKRALDFMERFSGKAPFLLCLSTKAPHVKDRAPRPFQPDQKFETLYKDVVMPVAASATQAAFAALPEFTQVSEGRIRWQHRFATFERYQDCVKDYYRLITGVDDVVGQILARLEALGIADRTVIVFTSDNGFFLGEHGLAGKWLMYEESIRLPLLIYHPGWRRAADRAMIDEMALTIDIAPTILDIAGLDAPPVMQGRSLKPLLEGSVSDWRTDWLYEHHYDHRGKIPPTEGVRTLQWTYTRYLNMDPVYEELFDLKADPLQLKNLAADPKHAGTLEALRQRWRELAAETR